MYNVNYEEMWVSILLELFAGNSNAEMVLFAAYINDGLCYEFFCERIRPEVFYALRAGLKADARFRKAVSESAIVQRGVQRFICAAMEDWDMWFHFLDGTETILTTPELTKCLPIQDRNLACSLFALWRNQKLTEETWDSYLGKANIIN